MISELNEIVDVVDKNDNVIDSKQRSEVRRLNLIHRCSFIFLYNPK